MQLICTALNTSRYEQRCAWEWEYMRMRIPIPMGWESHGNGRSFGLLMGMGIAYFIRENKIPIVVHQCEQPAVLAQ